MIKTVKKGGRLISYDPIIKQKKKEGLIPTLAAFEYTHPETGNPGLAAWCPWCEAWHYHGFGEGHRVGHCHNLNSPARKHGYFLKIVKLPRSFVVQFYKTKIM